jgi:hypothetical protein
MKHNKAFQVLFLAMMLTAVESRCQDVKPSVDGLRNLFRSMEESISFGSSELIMCHPGILLDPSIDPDSRAQFSKAVAF